MQCTIATIRLSTLLHTISNPINTHILDNIYNI